MFEVIYFSRGGNTGMVANAIALELGVKAEDVKTKKELSKDSIVILGSGCYGGKPGEELLEFIQSHDFKGRKVALFGTSASGLGKEVAVMEELLANEGCSVVGKFCCTGKFLLSSWGHPNEKELEKARAFAREMKKA